MSTKEGAKVGNIRAFLLIAFGYSWAIWVPGVAAYLWYKPDTLPAWLLLVGLVGAYGPSVAAILVVVRTGGRPALVGLLKRLVQYRAALRWYVVATLFYPVIAIGSILALRPLGYDIGEANWASLPLNALLWFLFALPFGPLGEELGWRGYLLPVLQLRMNALSSSIVLGGIWTVWHIPIFFVPGAALHPDASVSLITVGEYLLGVIGTAILLTWLFNNTAGSVLLAILLHATSNAASNLAGTTFPDLPSETRASGFLILDLVKWLTIALVLVWAGPRHMRRNAQRVAFDPAQVRESLPD